MFMFRIWVTTGMLRYCGADLDLEPYIQTMQMFEVHNLEIAYMVHGGRETN